MKYLYTPASLSLMVNGELIHIDSTHPYYEPLVEACTSDDEAGAEAIVTQYKRKIDLRDDEIYYRGGILYVKTPSGDKSIDNSLTKRIIQLYDEGLDIAPLLNFIEKLSQNPHYDAIQDMYRFLDCNELPITEDGNFLAYKIVTNDLKDCYTKTFDNSPGKVVEMPRDHVTHDRNITCSSGLHFCSKEYLPQYGGFYGDGDSRIVTVTINPADVVSIPTDYNNAKGRTCRYKVVNVLPREGVKGAIDRIESNVIVKIGNWIKGIGGKLFGVKKDGIEEITEEVAVHKPLSDEYRQMKIENGECPECSAFIEEWHEECPECSADLT